jgi:cytochrome c5
MKHVQRVMLGCLALAATAALGQPKSEPQQQHSPPKSTKAVHTMNPDRGQQVFNQNCSRCHNAPEGVSPARLPCTCAYAPILATPTIKRCSGSLILRASARETSLRFRMAAFLTIE